MISEVPLLDTSRIKRVIIIRTDHLGDLLLSTPLIRHIRQVMPNSKLSLIASPANATALVGWDAIDDIMVFDPKWSLRQKWRFITKLRQTHWDLCLTLSPRTSAYLLGRLSGAPIRAGIVYSKRLAARLLAHFWLTRPTVLHIDELVSQHKPVPHEVSQLMMVAASLGYDATPGPLEIPVHEQEKSWALQALSLQFCSNRCIIGVHGAAKWLSDGWSTDDFCGLLRKISVSFPDAFIVLTFGPGDIVLQESVEASFLLDPLPRLFMPGQLPLSRWAALIQHCDCVVSPDTGSLHLAVALARPVVAMYEDSTFLHCSSQWAPWIVPHVIVRRGEVPETGDAIVNGLTFLLSRKGQ